MLFEYFGSQEKEKLKVFTETERKSGLHTSITAITDITIENADQSSVIFNTALISVFYWYCNVLREN
jgi:hypothetical protein